jgi:hypothetical protein
MSRLHAIKRQEEQMPRIDNLNGSNSMLSTRNRYLAVAATALFALPGPSLAADSSPSASAPTGLSDDRIICRKTAEVGSLVRRKKQCFTKAEWDKLAEAHQRGARKLMDGLTERYSCQPDPTDPNAPPC